MNTSTDHRGKKILLLCPNLYTSLDGPRWCTFFGRNFTSVKFPVVPTVSVSYGGDFGSRGRQDSFRTGIWKVSSPGYERKN